MIPREVVRSGDRVRGYLYDVRPEKRGPAVICKSDSKRIIGRTFKLEVPEIGEGPSIC